MRCWLLVLLLCCAPVLAEAPPEAWATGLKKILGDGKAPSLSVAVVQNGQLLSALALGLADPQKKVPATPQTRYKVGSVSKMFTAVALMQLVSGQKAGLDDPLAKYLPWAPHAAEITLRQLLQHRSGLPNYLDAALVDGRAKQPTTPRAILEGLQGPLDFPPGTAYEYSNSNYVALGLVVEQVSGMSLERYLQAHIFEPARLSETTFANPPPGTPLAVGVGPDGAPLDAGDPSWYYACGSLVTTASDLARFDIALMDGTLLPAPAFQLMQSDALPTQAPGLGEYGLGVQLYPVASLTMVGHHGGLPGYASDNEMNPPDRFAVVVLANDMLFPTSAVLQLALQSFYPDVWKVLTSTPRPFPADAYPATTAAVDAFVRGVLQKKVDPATLDAGMQQALTPDKVAALSAELAALGPFQSATWLGVTRLGVFLRHQYLMTFGSKKLLMSFVVDGAGKFVGVTFE